MARAEGRAKSAKRKTKTPRRSTAAARLLRRASETPPRRHARELSAPVTSAFNGLPSATLDRKAGDVDVEIAFGHAQHGKYTIQLFDPTGTQELASEPGVSTDAQPDRFTLALSPAALNGHLLQWSGAVDALSGQAGQQFSVLFDVKQRGQVVSGGHIEKSGPLNMTQAFLGALVLVSS